MSGASSRGGPARGTLAAAAVVVLVPLLAMLLPPLWLEAVSIAVSFAGGAVCCLVASRARGRGRRAWLGFGSLLLLWAAADVLWALVDLGLVTDEVSIADLVYLAGVPCAVVGMLSLPLGRWERGAAVRVALDVAVLVLPILAVADVLVVRSMQQPQLSAASAYLLAWPVIDVLLAALAFVLHRRAGGTRRDLALIVLAFTVWTVGDTWLAWLDLAGHDYFGSAAQLPFLLGPLLLALAALSSPQAHGRRRPAPVDEAEPTGVLRHATCRMVVVLPDLVVIVAGVVCIATGVQELHEWLLVGVGATLAVVRHALVAFDAQQLRDELERRVEERTERLAEVGDRLELILDSVGDGIVGIEPDGRIGFVNPTAAELLRTTPEALLGREACPALCTTRHQDCPLGLVASAQQHLDRVDTLVKRADGSLLPVELTATPAVSTRSRAVLGSVVVLRDVRERLAVEQVKQQFVSSVSHELRTPLTAIRGALEMLVDGDGGDLPPEAVTLVGRAERGVRRLTRLVDDLLDVERLASGTFSVVPRPVELAPLVHEVAETLSGWADQHGVRLRVGVAEGAALADADRVTQALVNLVGNAVKFSAPGGTVHLSSRSREDDVLVEVRDEGRGIPAQDLPHVFERFHQVAEGDATEKGGTGLGLTITRSIVQRHGGDIWVESRLGEGATFSFTLPVPPLRALPAGPGASSYDAASV